MNPCMPGRDRDAQSQLAAIVSSSEDAIISKDLDGIIRTWNRSAERIFGYTAKEAIGQPIAIIIPDDRLAEEDFVLGHIKAGVPVEHFETVRRRMDGTLIDISLTVSPIVRDGAIIGVSKIAREITEQKRLQRAAEDASRMKDEFLAMLSHELRTPLNTVMGYMKILRRPDLTPELRDRALDAMERNSQALTQLVNDVLDTSRIVTGKMRLVLAPVSLTQAIVDAIDTVRPTAASKGVRLESNVEEDLEVVGDQDRLRQALWNLLVNAVKFTDSGGVVSVMASAEHGGVRVLVSDTGIGIAPEHVPFVFQRFWQAESGASREYGGLGLGLALVRHIVEMHGGTAEVTSAGAGKGATFALMLPRSGTSVGRHPEPADTGEAALTS